METVSRATGLLSPSEATLKSVSAKGIHSIFYGRQIPLPSLPNNVGEKDAEYPFFLVRQNFS